MIFKTLIAQQILINDSKVLSQSIQDAWKTTWDVAFNGNIFRILTNLGLTVAISCLLLWLIIFFRDLVNDRSYQKFSEIIWPIIVILLLSNGGKNLILLTTGMRSVINTSNDEVLTQLIAQADLNKTLDGLSSYSNISTTLNATANQCYVLKAADQQACIDDVIKMAKSLKADYDASFVDVSGALGTKLQGQIDNFSKNPVGTLAAIPGAISSSVLLAAAESFMVAMLAAFQALIEVSILLTGLMGPIAVGASLLPIGAKPFYVWLTSFWSLGIAKLSLNIIIGLVAVAVSTAGKNDNLSIAITLGFLSPILALSLASGGGMAIFSAILAAASAAASTGLNMTMRFK
jgi:hypothetical protein